MKISEELGGRGASGLACAPSSLWKMGLSPRIAAPTLTLSCDFPFVPSGARKARLDSRRPVIDTCYFCFPRRWFELCTIFDCFCWLNMHRRAALRVPSPAHLFGWGSWFGGRFARESSRACAPTPPVARRAPSPQPPSRRAQGILANARIHISADAKNRD